MARDGGGRKRAPEPAGERSGRRYPQAKVGALVEADDADPVIVRKQGDEVGRGVVQDINAVLAGDGLASEKWRVPNEL